MRSEGWWLSVGNIRWTDDSLRRNLQNLPRRAHSFLAQATEYQTLKTETYARSKARWTDRSTNARNGLTAIADVADKVYQIHVFHKVSYGVYLEVRFGGRYAIISETVIYNGKEFQRLASKILVRIATEGV